MESRLGFDSLTDLNLCAEEDRKREDRSPHGGCLGRGRIRAFRSMIRGQKESVLQLKV